MKLSNTQAHHLLDVLGAIRHINGYFAGYTPAQRNDLYNEIVNQQGNEVRDLEDSKD